MERSTRGNQTGPSSGPKGKSLQSGARGPGSPPGRVAKPAEGSRGGAASRPASRASGSARANGAGGRTPEGSRPARARRPSAQRPVDKENREAVAARRNRAAPVQAGARRGEVTRAAPRSRGSGGSGTPVARTGRTAKTGRHREAAWRSIAARIVGVTPRTMILLVLLVMFIVLSISPVTRNLEATGRLNKMEAELKKEKAATESLEKEVKEAGTADYVVKEARKQHMVAPGEIPYLVTTDQPEGEVQYRVKALQSMEEAWARVRQMLHSVPRQQ